MTVKTKCITAIKERVGDKLTRKEIDEVVTNLEELAQTRTDLGASYARRLKLLARQLSEKELKQRSIEKRQRVINVLREKALTASVLDARGDASKNLSKLMVGDTDHGVGSGNSQDARVHTYSATMRGQVVTELRRDGVDQFVAGRGLLRRRDPEFELAVYQEMDRLNGVPGAIPTGNHQAGKVAAILNKYFELQRRDLNDAGAFIGKTEFRGAQTHDPYKVSRAGLAEIDTAGMNREQRFRAAMNNWIAYITPRLAARTFDGVKDTRKFLEAVFTNLATGNHLGRNEGKLGGDFTFIGPGNLAKKLSHERVLHFKDAKSAFEYNERFGQGSLFDNFFYGIDSTARDVETLRTWGVNPEAMFDRIVHKAIDKAKAEGNIPEVERLETGMRRTGLTPGLKAQFDSVTGIADIPGNPRWARWGQAIRTLQSMTKLGGMLLSSFPDIAVRANVMRRNGINALGAVADGFRSIARGHGSEELRGAMANVGIGIDGTLGSVMSRFTGQDNLPGNMSKMLGHFFRFNLSTWWQDAQMTGSGFMLASNLANNIARDFDALHPALKRVLASYDIGPEDWTALRNAELTRVPEGAMLLPDTVADEVLRQKLQTYYVDQARESMTMGGAAERAWITNFGPPGSVAGEMARFFLQFKNYPLTFARRHLVGGVKRGDGWGVAQMIAMTTVLGYVSMAAKDVAKGREPRDPTDPATWGAAFTQGGGLGIYGDFLLGEYDRFGRTLSEAIVGPSFSDAGDIIGLFAKIATGGAKEIFTKEGGDWGKVGTKALDTLVQMTPFGNLFYTRAALDYGILWHLKEAMDPGAMKRMEQRLERENNQEYIIKPTSVAGGLR